MEYESGSTGVSKGMLWTGRVISALAALMFTFDGVVHLMKPAAVVDAFA